MFQPATTRHLKKRCIVKEANFEKLNKAVYTWFIRWKGAPVSGSLLQEKALQMFKILYPDKDADSFKVALVGYIKSHIDME